MINKSLIKKVSVFSILFFIATYASLMIYINRSITPPIIEESEQYVFYLAYGSNMSTRYLSNVRHVESYNSFAATLNDYEVRFSLKGIKYIEPAFANMVPSKGTVSYGVVHMIKKNSLKSIVSSESSIYKMKEVNVIREDGSQVTAWSLIGMYKDNDSEGIPSKRYLGLLVEGAEEHGLPLEYRNQLDNTDSAYIPILSEITGMVIYLMVISKSLLSQ